MAAKQAICIRCALVSVSDKSGVVEFCRELTQKYAVHLISTGGTFKHLQASEIPVQEVSDFTGFPEMLDGRVKTLHPKVHAVILANRDLDTHTSVMQKLDYRLIDMVVVNLYPFEATVQSQADFSTCIENIDIGGPAMLRSASKNARSVLSVSSPSQYSKVLKELLQLNGHVSSVLSQQFALAAFRETSHYDSEICAYLAKQQTNEKGGNDDRGVQTGAARSTIAQGTQTTTNDVIAVSPIAAPAQDLPIATDPAVENWLLKNQASPPVPTIQLKYGLNPHQIPSYICTLPSANRLPFTILNGSPGYINFLDAAHAWQLVHELRVHCPKDIESLPAAASFKHVSPAGAALGIPLEPLEVEAFDIPDSLRKRGPLSSVACALIRARNGDPLCSFGDFIAVSDTVDEESALFLKGEVSDGIVAPGFTAEALDILQQKKGGKYVIIQADISYQAPEFEFRELFGMGFVQRRNTGPVLGKREIVGKEDVVLSSGQLRDLNLAALTLKFTQSNSVCLARGGQVVGVSAGQQSRVDAVKLACRKSQTWRLRRQAPVLGLTLKSHLKRQDRVNGRCRYIEGSLQRETIGWEEYFDELPEPLAVGNDALFQRDADLVAASDGFFPFPDSIAVLSQFGVAAVCHPGGSIADKSVSAAADQANMALMETGVRLFLH